LEYGFHVRGTIHPDATKERLVYAATLLSHESLFSVSQILELLCQDQLLAYPDWTVYGEAFTSERSGRLVTTDVRRGASLARTYTFDESARVFTAFEQRRSFHDRPDVPPHVIRSTFDYTFDRER
jgi:hypothetical protein